MHRQDFEQLTDDIRDELARDQGGSFAILGHTPVAYDIIGFFHSLGADRRLLGIYDAAVTTSRLGSWVKALPELATERPGTVVVASDASKEELLQQAVPHLLPTTTVLIAGYGHFQYRDDNFEAIVHDALVPSLANGYPYTLVHLWQCLQNASRLDLQGIVAEFGMFKGGTTMMLARFIEQLGRDWRVIGFDTFAGFPEKRSCLDMYAHPGCVFRDEAGVRQYLAGRRVEIVAGDIVSSASRLATEDVILAFVDTDNYSSAAAVLEVIQDRVVPGGAIVFDHFTGRNRFRYTLGERIAAKRLLTDPRYFNLHDTGVFMKQR